MQYCFTFIQKAFIVNSKWQVLVARLRQTGPAPVLYDFPGGKLDFKEGLRSNLIEKVKTQTGLTVVTVSAPLDVTTYLDWMDRSQQIIRSTFLCVTEGLLNPPTPEAEYLWVDPSLYTQYTFPDEGYAHAFQNYLSHSELASSEFLGSGILMDTVTYLRSQPPTPLI